MRATERLSIEMKKITDFLKTKTKKEDLKSALSVLREFKSLEGEREWMNIPFMAWIKLEQLEEFLAYLVDGEDLKEDTVKYMNNQASCNDGVVDDGLKEMMTEQGFEAHKAVRDSLNKIVEK